MWGIVTTNADGEEIIVHEHSSVIDASHMGGKSFIPGTRWLELADGSKVNYIDEQTFEVVSTGERLTCKVKN